MREIIKNIGDKLKEIVNYRFLRWKGKLKYPYFVGELYQDDRGDESGETGYSFLLTGFYRGEDVMQLYDAAEKIEATFPKDTGSLIECRNGWMLVFWDTMLTEIPDTDTELIKIQITLKVKRWKGKG